MSKKKTIYAIMERDTDGMLPKETLMYAFEDQKCASQFTEYLNQYCPDGLDYRVIPTYNKADVEALQYVELNGRIELGTVSEELSKLYGCDVKTMEVMTKDDFVKMIENLIHQTQFQEEHTINDYNFEEKENDGFDYEEIEGP